MSLYDDIAYPPCSVCQTLGERMETDQCGYCERHYCDQHYAGRNRCMECAAAHGLGVRVEDEDSGDVRFVWNSKETK